MKIENNAYKFYSLDKDLNTSPEKEEERINKELVKYGFSPSDKNIVAFIELNNFLLEDFTHKYDKREETITIVKESKKEFVGGIFPIDFSFIDTVRDFLMENWFLIQTGRLTYQIIKNLVNSKKKKSKFLKIDEYLLDISKNDERIKNLEERITKLEKNNE